VQQIVRRLRIDAEQAAVFRRQREAERRQHAHRKTSFHVLDRAAQERAAEGFLLIERPVGAMVGEAVNGQHHDGVFFLWQRGEVGPRLVGPEGGRIGVGEPAGAHGEAGRVGEPAADGQPAIGGILQAGHLRNILQPVRWYVCPASVGLARVQKSFPWVERVDLNALEPLEVKRFHLGMTRSQKRNVLP
jgi:hypothetical protein